MSLESLLSPLLALDGLVAAMLMTEDGLPVETIGRELDPDVAAAEMAAVMESARTCFKNLEFGEPASMMIALPQHEVMIFGMAHLYLVTLFAPRANYVRAKEAVEELRSDLLELFGVRGSVRELLQQALEVEGVAGAAVMSAEGEPVESVSKAGIDLELTSRIVADGLSEALKSLLGDDEVAFVMLEYEHGAILVAPLQEAAYFGVVALEASQDVGRVRLKLQRLLERLSKAVRS